MLDETEGTALHPEKSSIGEPARPEDFPASGGVGEAAQEMAKEGRPDDFDQKEAESGEREPNEGAIDERPAEAGVGEVIEVRRKLSEVPKTRAKAIAAVKEWVASHQGRESALPIEQAVIHNLAQRSIVLPKEILAKGWSAEARKAGGWVVSFKFLSGGQMRVAEWVVDDVRREVWAGNEVASELEWVEDTTG